MVDFDLEDGDDEDLRLDEGLGDLDEVVSVVVERDEDGRTNCAHVNLVSHYRKYNISHIKNQKQCSLSSLNRISFPNKHDRK